MTKDRNGAKCLYESQYSLSANQSASLVHVGGTLSVGLSAPTAPLQTNELDLLCKIRCKFHVRHSILVSDQHHLKLAEARA